MKDDSEIELMMMEMKAEGRSDEEIGYAVSKDIYGENSSLSALTLFKLGIDAAEKVTPGDGFVAGSRKFCEEQLRRFQ